MLDNAMIDRFLSSRLRRLKYLPATSYQSVFGGYHGDNKLLITITGPTGIIANLDKKSGMGTHWVCIVFMPGTIYYYDPLLPNKEYELPREIKEYFEDYQAKGGRIVMNLAVDQEPMLPANAKPTDPGMRENTMCGAYSAMMMLELDKASVDPQTMPAKFYMYHQRLKRLSIVRLVYDKMMQP